MWKLEYIESWEPKNLYLWTVVLEKTLESPLACQTIQPVHPKGNHSWIVIGRTDAEAETPILQPPYLKNWLIGNNPDAGKDWRWEEKGKTEDEMVGWHHRFNGHECEQAPGISDGKGSQMCCSPWGQKSQTQLSNWTDLTVSIYILHRNSVMVLCCGPTHAVHLNYWAGVLEHGSYN